MACRAVLNSISSAIRPTPAYTTRPWIWGYCIAWCPAYIWFCWFSSFLSIEKGRGGWVDPGGWLHTKMV